MSAAAKLKRLLADLAGPMTTSAVAEITDPFDLFPEEAALVARAVEKRQNEFAAGRRAARAGLVQLGVPAGPILTGAHRSPAWPDGVTGSLSHDQGMAIAVVARTAAISHLGVDLVEAAPFPEKLRSQILLTPNEMAQDAREARLTFSAKETIFKALYPSVGAYFGFDAVEVTPDFEQGRFSARILTPLGPFRPETVLEGRIAVTGPYMVSFLAIAA